MADRDSKVMALLRQGFTIDEIEDYVQRKTGEKAAAKGVTGPLAHDLVRAPGPWADGYEGAKSMPQFLPPDASGIDVAKKIGPMRTPYLRANPFAGPTTADITSSPEIPPEWQGEVTRKLRGPVATTAGVLAGAATGGALSGPVSALVGSAPASLAPALGLAGAAAEGAGTGYADGLVSGLVEGRDLAGAHAQGVDTAKIGGVLGPGAKLVGETVAAAARPVVRAGQNLMRKDPIINQYATAKEAGVYGTKDMQDLAAHEPGIDEAVRIGRQRILDRDEELATYGGALYRGGEDVIPNPDDILPTAQLHRNLNRSVQRYPNGNPINQGVQDVVDEVKDNTRMVTRQRFRPVKEAELQTNVRPADTKTVGGYRVETQRRYEPDPDRPGDNLVAVEPLEKVKTAATTKRGIIAQRRALRDKAYKSAERTPENAKYQDAYGSVNKALSEAVPELKPLDEEWSKFRQTQKRRWDILRRNEEGGRYADLPEVTDEAAEGFGTPVAQRLRVGDEIQIGRNLARVNDPTVPGREMAPYLKELAAQDPEFAAAIKFIADKKALEGTRFSWRELLPSSFTGATGGAGFAPFLRQNLRALGASADTALGAAGKAAELAPQLSVNPLVRAMIIDQARQAQLANKLKGGGK